MAIAFGRRALEQFLNAGKTLRDVFGRCDTTGMEGTHGQLGTGLADGLGGDDADSLTDLNAFTVGHIGTVAVGADADVCIGRS